MLNVKKSSRVCALVCGCWSVVWFVGMAFSAEEHPDWNSICSSGGSLTIPANQTYVAYESDMQYINQLNSLTVKGVLIFDNTTTWLAGSDGYPLWMSSGTIVKRGASKIECTTESDRVFGTLIIEEGEFVQKGYYAWGAGNNAKIIVKDGATFRFDHANDCLGNTRLYASGRGVRTAQCPDGQGAVIIDKSGYGFPYLEISNDTYVVINKTGPALSEYVKDGGGSWKTLTPGTVNLNGHTLTIGGTTTATTFKNENFLNGGKIVFAAGNPLTATSEGTVDFRTTDFVVENNLTLAEGTWNSDVEVAAGASLSLKPKNASTSVTVNGRISGEGSVLAGTAGVAATVYLAYPLIDWSKISILGGTVAAAVGFDENSLPRWSASQVLNLAKAQNTTVISVETTGAVGGGALTITGADIEAVFGEKTSITARASGTGDGYYTVKGPFDSAHPLDIDLSSGRLRLSGEDPISIRSMRVYGPDVAMTGGTLVLDGAKKVDYGANAVYVGLDSKSTSKGVGRVVVTNSLLTGAVASDYVTGQMSVGYAGNGIVEVCENGVLSNKCILGGGKEADGYCGSGALYQRGGKVFFLGEGGANQKSSIGCAGSCQGYYALENGIFEALGTCTVGAYGRGHFFQIGGESRCRGLTLGSCNNGSGIVTVMGGLMDIVSGSWSLADAPIGGSATLTVDGPGAVLRVRDGLVYEGGGSAASWVVQNVNHGGTLEMSAFIYYRARDYYTSAYPFILNVNGGVLKKSTTNWANFLNGDTGKGQCGMSKAVVYEDGATFDVDAAKGEWSTETGCALEGATGNGIASIALAEPIPSMVVAPTVEITGDGYGATAVALLDTRTSTVTNILVTAHGWGYSKAGTSIALTLNKGVTTVKTLDASEFEVAPNVAGGFTKKGAGCFKLANVNTWGKWTRVLGGTVKALNAGAIPDGTVLTVAAGATLDLNATTPTFVGLSADSAGTVANGSVVLSGTWDIALADLPDAEGALSSDVVLTAGYTINVTDVPEDGRSYTFFRVSPGHTISGVPTLTGVNADRWKLKLSGGSQGSSLRLIPRKGLVLVVR